MGENNTKVIVRTEKAGVFYGEIESRNGSEVKMKDARCLWYWDGAASLMELAKHGVKRPENCKFTVTVSEIFLIGVCEILLCNEEAIASIEGVKEWRA